MSRRVHVVGSGPNGLSAALVLQRAGVRVVVHERAAEAGGGLRSEPLMLPGYLHDGCSAVHPLAAASPFFRTQDLAISWIHPPLALAHPFDDGTAAVLEKDLRASAATLGLTDAAAYRALLSPLARHWPELVEDVLAPPHVPRAPLVYAQFARKAVRSAHSLATHCFTGSRARALFAGLAAHGTLPLERAPSAGFGLVLALCAHGDGWPLVRGGSQRLAEGLVAQFRAAGGELRLEEDVTDLDALEPADAIALDTSPESLLHLLGGRLPYRPRERLRNYRYGPGVQKVEWVLREPIPWRARECGQAGTVHLGGSLEAIAASLSAAASGRSPVTPFVLVGQPTQFDASRAPPGGHIAWGYCAVPFASPADHTERIERQVERFAPGFRDLILARHSRTAAELPAYNPNLVGGSIGGAAQTLRQFFLGPTGGTSPYRTGVCGIYLCSAATPPGPGTHGMCGYHAAIRVLRDLHLPAAGLSSGARGSIF